jgi:hypothetical protein
MLISMPRWARPFLCAALFTLVPALTSAQTLIVRGAPAGEAVELVVNTETVGKATVDANGDAIIGWTLGGPEMEGRIYVDICPGTHRVMLLDRNLLPRPQDAGCERRDVIGVFWLKPQSTLVVTVGSQIPRVLLRQEPVTIAELDAPPGRRTVPTGLMIFGGVGGQAFSNIFDVACGNASPCDGGDSGIGYTGGAELWVTKWLSIEGAAIRTPWPSFEGGEGQFVFTSEFEPRLVVTAAGKLGVPLGPVRLYGKGGGIYHRAKLSTEQSMAGETLRTAFETEGWGWLAGGGIEGWVRPSVGLYLEVTSASLKGEDPGGGEAVLDERLNSLFVGLRLRILGGR